MKENLEILILKTKDNDCWIPLIKKTLVSYIIQQWDWRSKLSKSHTVRYYFKEDKKFTFVGRVDLFVFDRQALNAHFILKKFRYWLKNENKIKVK